MSRIAKPVSFRNLDSNRLDRWGKPMLGWMLNPCVLADIKTRIRGSMVRLAEIWSGLKTNKIFRIVLRVFLASLLIFISVNRFNRDDELNFAGKNVDRGARANYIISQIQAINSGHYLIDENNHQSLTRNFRDDIGPYVWLADIALVKRIFSKEALIFSVKDIYRIQLFMIAFFFIAVFLPFIPLKLSLTASLTLQILIALNVLKWDIIFRWPPTLSAILTLTLLAALIDKKKEDMKWKNLLQVTGISLFMSFLSYLRKDGYFISLFPFAALLLISAIMFGGSFIRFRTRKNPSEIETQRFRNHRSLNAILIVSLTVVVSMAFVSKGVLFLNLKLFEIIEKTSHQPKFNGHLFWHPIFLGIGGARYNTGSILNHENIIWTDYCAYTNAEQTIPGVVVWSDKYEEVLKKSYGEIFGNNTKEILNIYLTKFLDALKFVGYSKIAVLMILLLGLAFLAFSNVRESVGYIFYIIGFLALFMTAILPSILTIISPSFIQGFYAVVDGGMIFTSLAIIMYAKRKNETNPSGDSTASFFKYPLFIFLAFFLSFTLVLTFMCRSTAKERSTLESAVENNRLTRDLLQNTYHADIINVFNSLPPALKNTFIEKLASDGLEKERYAISEKGTDIGYKVKGFIWHHDRILIFLEFEKPVNPDSQPLFFYIPVTYRVMENNRLKSPRFSNAILIHNKQESGIYCFSFLSHETNSFILLYPLRSDKRGPLYTVKAYAKESPVYEITLK
jgi:hypothetical protein